MCNVHSCAYGNFVLLILTKCSWCENIYSESVQQLIRQSQLCVWVSDGWAKMKWENEKWRQKRGKKTKSSKCCVWVHVCRVHCFQSPTISNSIDRHYRPIIILCIFGELECWRYKEKQRQNLTQHMKRKKKRSPSVSFEMRVILLPLNMPISNEAESNYGINKALLVTQQN